MGLSEGDLYVTGRRRRGRPHKVYIFLISINSRVDIAMSVCPYEQTDLRDDKSYKFKLGQYRSHI